MKVIGVVTVGRSDYGIYRPILRAHVFDGPFAVNGVAVTPFDQHHGYGTLTKGFRIGGFAYSTDAVDLPGVVLLFSLLGFGAIFGTLGVILAAPLSVVTYVLVKRLYVIEALHTATPIPGEGKK